jgi:molybdate transport system substrate-binding protein
MTAPITGISSMATAAMLAELARDYEAQTGQPVAIESAGGVDAARRVRAGEPLDLVVLAAAALAELAAAGHVRAASVRPVARSAMVVAVRCGAAAVAIDSEAALRDAVRAAGALAYSTGPSGNHLLALLERWGGAQALGVRLVQAPPGVPVAALLARGDAPLGFQQLSELQGQPGVTVLGALPPGAELVTLFSGGLASASPRPQAAARLLDYLASPETGAIKRRHGLESP